MKKIIFTFSALFSLSLSGFGQANISVEAPRYDENNGTWAAPCAPSGTSSAAYHRACYFISQAEMARMAQTNSVITSFGFDIFRTASPSATGQFSLYLQNTSDVQYTKSLTYSTAINGMSMTYTGNLTVSNAGTPASPTAAVTVSLTTPFTYTGGGIYVAWDWYGAAANSTVFARYFGNVALGTNGGGFTSASSAGPAPNTMTAYIRPCMRFIAGNTATNDISVIRLNAPGSVSKLMGAGHVISAVVKNNGVNAVSNVPVSLTVGGANPFSNTQTVSSIPAGGIATVSFSPYNPTTNGTSTMMVTVPLDQYSANDTSFVWTQTVGCSDYGNSVPDAPSTFTDAGYGYSGSAMLVTPINLPASATLSAIKFAVYTGQTALNMCGVLLDGSGTILAMTKTLSVAGATPQVYTTYKFDSTIVLNASTPYYFGMAQLASGFPFGISEANNLRNFPNLYYNAPIAGGAIGGLQNQMSYVPMLAVLNFSNTYITAEASKTVVCNNKNGVNPAESITLTATGISGQTFQWVASVAPAIPTSSNTATIVVTPSTTASQGSINYSVTANQASSGCKSNQVVITVSVNLNLCTGIADNGEINNLITVYPNPSSDNKVTVKGLEGTNSIAVLNLLGQTVRNTKSSDESTVVDLQGLAAGHYMIKVTNSANQTKVIKFLKANN